MYAFFSNLYPKTARVFIFEQLNFFTIKLRKEFVAGAIYFFSFCIALSFSFQFSKSIFEVLHPFFALILLFFIVFILLQIVIYAIISIIITNRGRFIESVLPDALQLISANLRAGMTIDRAIMASNRVEFGYFNEQFNIVGKEVSTGTEIRDALLNMVSRIRSKKFAKSIELIVEGMRSGGELSRLLNEVAENLVHQKTVEERIKNSVTTYLIFIGAAVGFAAPMLYGLSTVIVKVIVETFASVEIPPSTNMPFTINMSDEIAIFLPQFVKVYTRVSLITLSLSASILLGLIKKGEARYGLNYIPFIMGLSLIMYYLVSTGAGLLFSTLL